MDIVTILILDEWIWKVVLRTKLVGPIQFFLLLYYLICFCFRFLATFHKWLNNNYTAVTFLTVLAHSDENVCKVKHILLLLPATFQPRPRTYWPPFPKRLQARPAKHTVIILRRRYWCKQITWLESFRFMASKEIVLHYFAGAFICLSTLSVQDQVLAKIICHCNF